MASAYAKFTGEVNGDAAGISVSTAGDVNSDGYSDLLIGSPEHSSDVPNAGAVYVMYFGPNYWTDWWDPTTGNPHSDIMLGDEYLTNYGTARIVSDTEDEGFGTHINGVGSINGDAHDDFAVGIGAGQSPKYHLFFGGGI